MTVAATHAILDDAGLTDEAMQAHLAAFRQATVEAKRPPSRVIVTTADNFRDGLEGCRAMESQGWTVVK